MFARIFCVCILLVASLCVAEASAQCSAGVCRLPGRPVARAATAPVRALRAAQPLRRAANLVANVRPLRRVAGIVAGVQPVRRAAGLLLGIRR